ncbi:MAG: hypothetical protein WC829_11850 [Hyphomicrobium sp.]|jgi:hypothetical protein
MPAPKRSARRQTPKAAKAPRQRAKTQALSVNAAAVRREPVRGMPLPANPLTMLEPLRRAMVDRQFALLGAAMTWAPANILVSHQAAFWSGFAEEDTRPAQTERKARRTPKAKPKAKPVRKRPAKA